MGSSIFDKIQDTVIMASREVEHTAKELTGKAKLQYEIKTRESYLNDLYKELGKKYYTEHKDDEGESFAEIADLLDELDALRKELNDRRGAKYCPRCGAQVASDADYCSKCGEFLHSED